MRKETEYTSGIIRFKMDQRIKEIVNSLKVVLRHCDGGAPGKGVPLGGSAMYESLLSELDCLIMLLDEGYDGIVSKEIAEALYKNRRMEIAMHSEGYLKILKRLFARAVRYTDANILERIIAKNFSKYSLQDAMRGLWFKLSDSGEYERCSVVDAASANLILEMLSRKDVLDWLKHMPVNLPKYVGSVSYSAMISYAIEMNTSVDVVELILEQDSVYDMAAIFSRCAEYGRYDILDLILKKKESPLSLLASTEIDVSKMDFNNETYLARKYAFLKSKGVMTESTVEPTKELFEWVLSNVAPQSINIDLMRLKRVIKESVNEPHYGLNLERVKRFVKELERYQLVVVAGAENGIKQCLKAL